MSTGTALAFRSVTKRFRNGRVALADVSWSVARGARACLLGPNGAGKSTSVRILEGALRPSAGSAELLGEPVDGPGYADARLRTGVVPQGPGMYPDLTAGEYLRIAADLYGATPARAIATFGLRDHLRTRMAELSGGYQRRVTLAAAFVAEPELLLLDEPTVGLDPKAAHEVHQYLREVMADRTVLLCTHNLAEAEALCDEVIILQAGRVIVQGRLAELRRGARSRLRLAAHQGPEAVVARLNGLGPVRVEGRSVLLEVPDPEAAAPRLLRRLLADGVDVYECTPVQATLEDVFLEAVG
ncbi:MAG TPA: ABC transporter ATP-binding protein [Candidatus Dormibacteraeota bacterium]|nr:ABC transporter ATP-binding protein [Candidatus Dormibacteraeota bacterium]